MKVNKKIYLGIGILILIILSIDIVFALPSLQVNPSIINTNILSNQILNKTINITNIGNQTLTNLSFTKVKNISINNIPSQLARNQSATVRITAPALNYNNNSLISFYYFTNTTTSPAIKNVNISRTQYNPININIKLGDTIIWKNQDNITHTVSDIANSFDFTIPPNSSIAYSPTSTGTINYFDRTSSFGGSIIISSNIVQTLVHNSALDVNLPIIVTTSNAPTTATVSIVLQNVTIAWNEALSNIALISNTGNDLLRNGRIKMNWGTFPNTVYNIPKGSNPQIVQFSVTPVITQDSQTNRSYTLTLNLTGDNIPLTQTTMRVFIRNHAFNGTNPVTNTTPVYFATDAQIRALCLSKPDLCPKTYINQTIYAQAPLKYNMTQAGIQSLLDNYTAITGKMDRGFNDIKTAITNDITDRLDRIEAHLNAIDYNQTRIAKNSDDEANTRSRTFILEVIAFVLAIISIIIYIVYHFVKKGKEELANTTSGTF